MPTFIAMSAVIAEAFVRPLMPSVPKYLRPIRPLSSTSYDLPLLRHIGSNEKP
jgi:hypothetical protein